MKTILYFAILSLFFRCGQTTRTKKEQTLSTKEVAGILVPNSIVLLDSASEFMPNGDGYLIYRYLIDESLYSDISQQLKKKENIRSLPFKNDDVIDNLIFDFVGEKDEGSYFLENDNEDPRDILLVVLNKSKMHLVVMASRQ